MLRSICQASIGLFLLFIYVPLTLAQTTMTYQGQLQEGSGPFDGQVDMSFELFDSESDGNSVAGPITINDVAVSDGLFQVELDFGAVYGQPVWLEITVGTDTLTTRQPVTASPVASHALNVADGVSGVWNQNGDAISYWSNGQGAVISPEEDADRGPRIVMGNASNQATAWGATVSGGGEATAPNVAGGRYAVIAGGFGNAASGNRAVVGGGADNEALGSGATIGGGRFNVVDTYSATIAGGLSNEATGSSSVIGGGWRNRTGDSLSVVPGGQENEARAKYSFAGGYNAIVEVDHRGAFVWADDVNQLSVIASDRGEPFHSQAANEFAVRATGGVRLVTAINDNGDETAGMHILPSGRVVVNSDAATTARMNVESEIDEQALRVRVDGQTALLVDDNEGVSVGSVSVPPAEGLRVQGEMELITLGPDASATVCISGASSGTISTCSSSRRLKKDIAPLVVATDIVEKLQAVTFRWKRNGREDVGLIAEEVAEIEPRLAQFNDEGEVTGVKYRHLTAVLVRALQEQSGKISQSRDRLAALEDENAELRQLAERNRELEQRLAALEEVLLKDKRAALTE